ncbi:MAG: apolipoprotein N-acyltransferase [Desulfobacterales bacterium]|nr:apolipoprotein N-acyltransferase [Desulfobacterales bacterium]
MDTGTINTQKIFFSIVSGLLLTVIFPHSGLHIIAWIALIPFFFAIKGLSVKNSFRVGLITGMVHYISLLYWLVHTMNTYGYLPIWLGIIILVLFSFYLALYVACFSMAIPFLCKKPLLFIATGPALWVLLEHARSYLLSGFPWALLGHSQHNVLNIIQIVDITGVYGISFILAFSNCVLFMVLLYLKKNKWYGTCPSKRLASYSILVLTAILLSTLIYSRYRINEIDNLISDAPKKRVSVIQGNVDQSMKWEPENQKKTVDNYINLSNSVATAGPDLIIWPETALPFYYLYDYKLTGHAQSGFKTLDTYFLVGSPSFIKNAEDIEYFNSAYLIDPERLTPDRYDKTHLVPFGEYVPLGKWLPIGKMVAGIGDFSTGEKGKVLPWGNVAIGTQICYEVIFPDLSRKQVLNNADLLVNITNDAWFGKTGAPYQHFFMTVFRAVENRRSLVRAANTGISGFIDPAGRVISTTQIFEKAAITETIPLLKNNTFYTKHGDIFAILCLIISVISVICSVADNRRKRR